MTFGGWAVVEWECCLKHPEDGAREGADFVKDHIIRVTEQAFDDFADGGTDDEANRKMLGLGGLSMTRPIRLGMVGGGNDAFIGGVHRIAARIDGAFRRWWPGRCRSSAEKAPRLGRGAGPRP